MDLQRTPHIPSDVQLQVAHRLAQLLWDEEAETVAFGPYFGVSPTFLQYGLSRVYGRLRIAYSQNSVDLMSHIGSSPLIALHVRSLVLDLDEEYAEGLDCHYTAPEEPSTFADTLLSVASQFTGVKHLVINWTRLYHDGGHRRDQPASTYLEICRPMLSRLWRHLGSNIESLQATVYTDALDVIAGFGTEHGLNLESFELRVCRGLLPEHGSIENTSKSLVAIARHTIVPVLSTLSNLTIWILPFGPDCEEFPHELDVTAFFQALNQHKGAMRLETLEIETPFITGEADELFHLVGKGLLHHLRSVTIRPAVPEYDNADDVTKAYIEAIRTYGPSLKNLRGLSLCFSEDFSTHEESISVITPIIRQNINLTQLTLLNRNMSQSELRLVLNSLTSTLLSLVISVNSIRSSLFDDLYDACPSLESLTLQLAFQAQIKASSPMPIYLMEEFRAKSDYAAAIVPDPEDNLITPSWHLNRGTRKGRGGMNAFDRIACERAFSAEMQGHQYPLWRLQYAAVVHNWRPGCCRPYTAPSVAKQAAIALYNAVPSLTMVEAWQEEWEPGGRMQPRRKPDVLLTRVSFV